MNRLHHLQKTLPYNLEAAKTNPQVEFIILDYNSSDGLADWIHANSAHLKGKVSFYRTTDSAFYKRSHSRNMAMRLASGDIICNLDADNYLGEGFVAYILKVFAENNEVFIAPEKDCPSDIYGKLCFRKSDFEYLGGYDEQIEHYGFEDIDLKNRFEKFGLKKVTFNTSEFTQAIQHSELERVVNESIYKNLKKILVNKISPLECELFFLNNDDTYESAKIMDSNYVFDEEFVSPLSQKKRYNIVSGTERAGNSKDLELLSLSEIKESQTKIKTIHFYSQLKNKLRSDTTIRQNQLISNIGVGFGKGQVHQIFNSNRVTQLC